jgi:hypothetical protein
MGSMTSSDTAKTESGSAFGKVLLIGNLGHIVVARAASLVEIALADRLHVV